MACWCLLRREKRARNVCRMRVAGVSGLGRLSRESRRGLRSGGWLGRRGTVTVSGRRWGWKRCTSSLESLSDILGCG